MIKACSKRQTAGIVLFQDLQRGTIMYRNHLARIDRTSDSDDCTVRSILVVMKIRVSVSSLSKVQLRHPWQESIFVICKNTYTLFAHPVLCSDFTPRALQKFTFCVITALHWIFATPGELVSRAR